MLFTRLLMKLTVLILISAISISLRYDSTNPQYLFIRLLHSSLVFKHYFISDSIRPNLSIDYRAFENMLRLMPLTEYDALTDPMIILNDVRQTSSLANVVPRPNHCHVTHEVFEHNGHTVNTYWVDDTIKNLEGHADTLIVFMHGGGYVLGDVHSYCGVECYLSDLFNVTILHLEYRLSPEHRFPVAVDDTLAVYHTLLRHRISPMQIIFMGDSAGGGLVLLTTQAIIEQQLPVPRGIIVISPWADLSTSSESYNRNAEIDPMLRLDRTRWVASQLLGPNRPQSAFYDPKLSPLFGSFEGFPPMYISVGTAEIIEDDSQRLVAKARDAGVDVTFEQGEHLMHIYPMFFPYYPEARQSLENIHQWLQTLLNK